MYSSANFPASHRPMLDREPRSGGSKWGKMLLDGLQSARLLRTRMLVREAYPIYASMSEID